MLQNRFSEDAPLLDHALEEFTSDGQEELTRISSLIEASQKQALDQLEAGMLTKGSLRGNFAQLSAKV